MPSYLLILTEIASMLDSAPHEMKHRGCSLRFLGLRIIVKSFAENSTWSRFGVAPG